MNRHLQILPLAVSLAIGTLSVNAATDGDTIRMLEQQLEQQQQSDSAVTAAVKQPGSPATGKDE